MIHDTFHSPLPCRLSSLSSTPPSAPQPPHPLLHSHAPPHHHTHLTCLCCYPQTSWPVLRGGTVRPMPELLSLEAPIADDGSEGEVTCTDKWRVRDPNLNFWFSSSSFDEVAFGSGGKHKRFEELTKVHIATDLNLRLTLSFGCRREIRRPGSPSMNFEESVTTTACLESGIRGHYAPDGDWKVLNLFI